MSIPQKIHYCWLSKEKMAANYIKCIDSWKRVMPDYELVLWDSNKFDLDSVPFVKEAVSIKKWAFAADYIRMHAVYTEGGIYLDSDVLVLKKFDEFLRHDFFTSIEAEKRDDLHQYENWTNDLNDIKVVNGCGLQAGIFGGVKGHPYLKDVMAWYENNRIILPDGTPRDLSRIKCPDVMAAVAQKYGFKYKNGEQKLADNMMIFDTKVFAHTIDDAAKGVYAIHWGEVGWSPPQRRLERKLRRSWLGRLLRGKKQVPALDEVIANGFLDGVRD
ncbi:MAG: polysaccharide biosynthesis protein [Chitinispirillia bacterium]|nr:polysaccharide biosynthesis protein [Chitinispirillia bacterium]